MDTKLKSDLFSSFLMSKKIMSGLQIKRLIESRNLSSLEEFYENRNKIMDTSILSDNQWERWNSFIRSPQYLQLDEYVEYVRKKNIFSINMLDKEYPVYLKNLSNMPLVLYLKGDVSLLSSKCSRVSMVGTRRPSSYGRRVTRDFAKKLAMHDVIIVSGLARGIDGISHESCLEVGGKTIAVLPCGLDVFYPPEHECLSREISEKGLLISELLPGSQAIRQYFPARNRILSAISDCVLIVEAGEKSGTLHTASFAAAQGKEVFVIPGSIYSDTASGNLNLMKDGAQIATEPEDIFAYLAGAVFFREIDEIKDAMTMNQLRNKINENPESLSSEEMRLILTELLMSQDLTADEIVAQTSIPFSIVAKELVKMEIEGFLIKDSQKYILTIRV